MRGFRNISRSVCSGGVTRCCLAAIVEESENMMSATISKNLSSAGMQLKPENESSQTGRPPVAGCPALSFLGALVFRQKIHPPAFR